MMSGSGVGGGREPVKIVVISTQYVETDETSFKSVVQELTGKDSMVRNIINKGAGPRKKQYYGMKMEEGIIPQSESAAVGFNNIEMKEGTSQKSLLTRDLSFKEFDRLLKEIPMPTVDELWAD